MKKWLASLLLLISANSYAQNKFLIKPQPGKIFITKEMDQDLEFKTDTTITTSFPGKSYKIKNDTLFLKEEYDWYGPNNSQGHRITIRDYKILYANDDKIILRDRHSLAYIPRVDTVVLKIHAKKSKPVTGFKELYMATSSGFTGSTSVRIDSVGNTNYFFRDSPFKVDTVSPKKVDGRLTPAEFNNFKEILAISLLKMLPKERGCGLDAAQTEFTIVDNLGVFFTKGCRMYLPQNLLRRYLENIATNPGFIANSAKK